MKTRLYSVLLFMLLAGCTNISSPRSDLAFIFTQEDSPVIEDISGDPDLVRKSLAQMHGLDSCGDCTLLQYKTLIEYGNINGYIPILIDYRFYCSRCPVVCGLNNRFIILINSAGQLMCNGEITSPDSMEYKLYEYYHQPYIDFRQSRYTIQSDMLSPTPLKTEITKQLISFHLKMVQEKLNISNAEFQNLSPARVAELKHTYPFIIEWVTGGRDGRYPQ